MISVRHLFRALIALPLLAAPAFGWGCEGHQMIAMIARAHLTPAASQAVDRLLREYPIDPSLNRFCKDRPNDPMTDAATWADDVRNIEKTAEWHYIDIPLAVRADPAGRTDLMPWCKPLAGGKPGCIVTAIDYEWGVLRDKTQPGAARAKALRYIIHFIGDLTQPLHATDNHDQGGNCTAIRFFSGDKLKNLHAIWDYEIIQRVLQSRNVTQEQYARSLDESFSTGWQLWGGSKIDPVRWAWESHHLAGTVAYGEVKPPLPTAPAEAGAAGRDACDAERRSVKEMDIAIGDEYTSHALPVIREQLAKAGYRLAELLNQTFPN